MAGGTLTAWILTTVGYKKRRNLLKNALWQLILISAGLIIWDFATGWRGWSLDIALPAAIDPYTWCNDRSDCLLWDGFPGVYDLCSDMYAFRISAFDT